MGTGPGRSENCDKVCRPAGTANIVTKKGWADKLQQQGSGFIGAIEFNTQRKDKTMKRLLTATAIAAVLGTTAIVAAPSFADPGHGSLGDGTPQLADASPRSGWHGHGHGMMMGGGMGHGMGPGMMTGYGSGAAGAWGCPGYGAANAGDLDLSADDVRKNLERQLAWSGNSRLKVGEIKQDGDDFIAHIVTQDDSLVDVFKIDGDTGHTQRID